MLMILVCSLIMIALAWTFSFLSFWFVLILILLNIGAIFAGSFIVCSGLYLKAHCYGRLSQKAIAITFDDGPDAVVTPRVLDILKEHGIKASFFLIGKNIEGNEHILKRMIAEGHIIGNHSFTHPVKFGFYSSKKVREDLHKNAGLIEKISGKKVNLFRPPFGVTNPNIAKAVRSLDYSAIGWNIRSLDGVNNNTLYTTNRVIKRLNPGGIILFHDNHEGIFTILEKVIKKTKNAGYTIIPLEEMLNIKTYQ